MASRFGRFLRRLRFGEPVVVVSGLPRSGTSMAMKMLEAGGVPLVQDGLRTADEDNPKGYFEDERVKNLAADRDKDWLRDARGRAVKVIAYLLKDLPLTCNYKVLFMNRDIREVLASQAKMLERRGERSETGEDRMIGIYEQDLERARFLLRYRPCFESLHLDYKDILERPRESAERIRSFLGMPLDVEKMIEAVDPSLYRNRRREPGEGS